jgi:hypothetical protein
VVPAALTDASFVTVGPLSDNAVVVLSRGDVLTEWRGLPVHADLPLGRKDAGLVSAPFQTDRVIGRIMLCDLVLPTPDVLPLTEVIARETGASLDQLHVTRRLAEVTLSEERIRVARDLHDGVPTVADGPSAGAASVATGAVGDLLIDHARSAAQHRAAIAMSSASCGRFIAGLQPTSRSDSPPSLVARSRKQERIVLEWKMPVILKIARVRLHCLRAHTGLPLMVHEAIVNAMSTGSPPRVGGCRARENRLRVVVSDDGRGFPFRGRYDDAELAEMGAAGQPARQGRVAGRTGDCGSTTSGSRVEIDHRRTGRCVRWRSPRAGRRSSRGAAVCSGCSNGMRVQLSARARTVGRCAVRAAASPICVLDLRLPVAADSSTEGDGR